ncbi:serine protease [Macrolepiota fuliginosa MF-IS2]|uniref:Serine protease n=1 Tax=Macrolepiota fuliginosa MF-IS2 TaxID=1400762 RepID=A0A9P6BX76_9AGAR|nr:serine protease [Macrolepiota fuliginosa MF-IS2]
MRFLSFSIATFALFAASVFGAPAAIHTIETFDGETTGRFLVTLKPGVSRASLIKQLKQNTTVTHEWDIINGFAGHLDDDTLNALRANPDVQSIAEDGVMHTMVTQTNAPWGLSRLSSMTSLSGQDDTALTFSYTYDASAGKGVDIYIVGECIYTAHSQFAGRARWGATFGGYADADGYGHGTHCAGTAAGSQFGVAKAANLIAVKVLSDEGGTSFQYLTSVLLSVSGLNWVAQQFASSGRPSIASLSFGGPASTVLDSAVTALVNAGVPVVVAAGNDGSDACYSSPGRAPAVITVGATSIFDGRSSWSNMGSCVDIFAPGSDITSAWIGSTTATNMISGTSMATPHVSGLMAYLVSMEGVTLSPSNVSDLLQTYALKNVLGGILAGTPNILAHNSL